MLVDFNVFFFLLSFSVGLFRCLALSVVPLYVKHWILRVRAPALFVSRVFEIFSIYKSLESIRFRFPEQISFCSPLTIFVVNVFFSLFRQLLAQLLNIKTAKTERKREKKTIEWKKRNTRRLSSFWNVRLNIFHSIHSDSFTVAKAFSAWENVRSHAHYLQLHG